MQAERSCLARIDVLLSELVPPTGRRFEEVSFVPKNDGDAAAILARKLAMAPPVVQRAGEHSWRVIANTDGVALARACVPPDEWATSHIPCICWEDAHPAGLTAADASAAVDVCLKRATYKADREIRARLRKQFGIQLRRYALRVMPFLARVRHP
jgi:hypothetical protein